MAGIREILSCLRSDTVSTIKAASRPGKALLYVWALEQKQSRRGWDESHAQDVMVPWVMKTGTCTGQAERVREQTRTFQRYYHLYRMGELERDIRQAGGVMLESGYEKDNWWAVAARADKA